MTSLSALRMKPSGGVSRRSWGGIESGGEFEDFDFEEGSRALQEPILPAKLFHTSDRRKCPYIIGRGMVEAVTAKTDGCCGLQFFVVQSAESNGNAVAHGFVTLHHGCVGSCTKQVA